MINLTPDVPEEFHKKGYFFTSNFRNYMFEITERENDSHCEIAIWQIGCIQDGITQPNPLDMVSNGEPHDMDLFCTMRLWGKYFFIRFDNNDDHPIGYQLYHPIDNEINPIDEMREVLKAAYDLGMKLGEIKIY